MEKNKDINEINQEIEKIILEGSTGGENIFPEFIPMIPLRDVVLFPNMIVPIMVARETSIEALQAALVHDRYIFFVLQRKPDMDAPEKEDVHSVGVIGKALQVLRLPNGSAKILIEGLERASLLSMEKHENYFRVNVSREFPAVEETPRIKAFVRTLIDKFSQYVKLSRSIPDEVLLNLPQIEDNRRLIYTVVAHMLVSNELKQQILEMPTIEDQMKLIAKTLGEEIEILELENSIDKEVKERLQKSQKDFYLHEQMRVIKEELGEDDEVENEIKELKRKIKKSGMPKDALHKANEEIAKLHKMHVMSPESTVTRNYLDWLISIPWKKKTEDNLDLKKARKILDDDHYGLDKAKERILEYLAVLKLSKKLKGPILCFSGPPGTGKTSLGMSVANAMGRSFVRMSLGGIRDEAEIRGHRRTYIGALPGRIIQNMKKAGTKNPVFLLDEIDKIGADFRGDPSSALLEVLDPEQNHAFTDHYLELEYDLSEVLFITTSNYEDSIPAPLLDRMEIIRLSGYLEFEKLGIAKRHLIPKQLEANGLTPEKIRFNQDALEKIIRNYTSEAGVRNLERTIASICRKVACEVVNKGDKARTRIITARSLTRYLGVPRYRDKLAERTNQVGMATGLAWTPVGGEILNIETSLMPGKGELILTGHLGDVMKESARAGLSWIKSNMKKLNIPADAFDKKDVHIHVPEGAIKKDGPSAGVSMVTSLISAATERPVLSTTAMTGEITLRGNVLAVGGLKEKALAAKRSGIKTIIIPRENEPDLSELPSEIKDNLQFILADTIDDVLAQALINES